MRSAHQFYFADVKRYQERLRQQEETGAFDFRWQQQQQQQQQQQTVVENNSELSRLSEFEIDGGGRAPAFSTPVRASFRQRMMLGRRRSAMEAARTPVKSDSGRLRPREVKRRSSSCDPAATPTTAAPGEEGKVSQSMVSAWSRFLDYEATLPELSSVGPLSPEYYEGDMKEDGGIDNPGMDTISSYSTSVRQLLRAGEACRRNRIGSGGGGGGGGQPEEDCDGELTRLSHLQSVAADGTETRLLLESLNRTRPRRLSGGGRIFVDSSDKTLRDPGLDQSTLLSESPVAFALGQQQQQQQLQQQHRVHFVSPPPPPDARLDGSSSSWQDHQGGGGGATRRSNNNSR